MKKLILIGIFLSSIGFASENFNLETAIYGEAQFKVETSVNIRGDAISKKIEVKACTHKLIKDEEGLFSLSAIEYKESDDNKMVIQTKRFLTDKYIVKKLIERTTINGKTTKTITCIPDCEGNCAGAEVSSLNKPIGFRTFHHLVCSDNSLREYNYELAKGENNTANLEKRLTIVNGKEVTVEKSTINIEKSGKINVFLSDVKREDTEIKFKAVNIKQKF